MYVVCGSKLVVMAVRYISSSSSLSSLVHPLGEAVVAAAELLAGLLAFHLVVTFSTSRSYLIRFAPDVLGFGLVLGVSRPRRGR